MNDRVGSGFTEGELDAASFWVRHRLTFRRAGRGCLLGINILLWSYVLWGLTDAFILSYERESRITQDIAQNAFLATRLESNRPRDAQQGTVSVFSGPSDRLDMIVDVENPNDAWWMEFTYRFNVSGEQTPPQKGFLLPEQRRVLGAFGFRPSAPGARTATLVVENIRWHRIDPSVVEGDYPAWHARHDRFRVEEVQFTPGVISGTQSISRSSFTLVNDSAYGFWEVPVYVVLRRATMPVAATTIVLGNVLPGERRLVQLDWLETLPAITNTDISAVVNFLDDSVYLPSTQQ
ncbi:MAG: hypothetical protein RL141_705 [Candidatus Parcubacteria bacterium]|jgi:hypothetical protein